LNTVLLASSDTVAGLQTCINRFWGSSSYRVNPETLVIEHNTKGGEDFLKQYRVVLKKRRYRFEVITEGRE
jgi:hypothetical protein